MTRRYPISMLLGALLVSACAPVSSGGDGGGGTSTSTSGASLSGSATSATGSMSEATASGGGPTTSTTSTATGPDSTSNPWTSGPCGSFLGQCGDLPGNPIECDSFAQDCPEGQKCAAVIVDDGSSWDGLRCVDVSGMDEPGELCTMKDVASGVDSCVKGAMCWDVDEQGVGYCIALCTGSLDAPVCENKASCTISANAILILCIPTCDPLLQDCPNPFDVCYPVNDGFTCAPDASGDEGQANDPCDFFNVCDPGLWCAEAAQVGVGCPQGSTGCCTPLCEFPGGACPNPDQQCVQYFDPMSLPVNDSQLGIGYCGVPG